MKMSVRSQDRLFGASAILFYVLSLYFFAGGVISGVLVVDRELTQPTFQVEASSGFFILNFALGLSQMLWSGVMFLLLGRTLQRFRFALKESLCDWASFSRLSGAFFISYLLGVIHLMAFWIWNPGSSLNGAMQSVLSGMDGDPLILAVVPVFGGAAALVVALLFWIGSRISRAYSELESEAALLRRDHELTI